MLRTKRTTFPLPQQDAQRLADLMRQHEYTAELRQEGNGWAVVYEPPARKTGQVFGKDIPTVEQLLAKLNPPNNPQKSGGAIGCRQGCLFDGR